MPLPSLTTSIPARDVAAVLAAIIQHSPQPLTILLEELSGHPVRLTIEDDGVRDLTAAEHFRLNAGPVTVCRYRAGLLTAGQVTAARTSLAWLPSRLPPAAAAALDAGRAPAGAALAPFGMHRTDRRAMALDGDGDEATSSSAVLVVDGCPAAIAAEQITT